jgi:hypothetical protein
MRKNEFVVICGLPRSGSSLLLRVLNRLPSTNLYGENFAVCKGFSDSLYSIKKTLKWDNSERFRVPKTRSDFENFGNHMLAWYNEFSEENIKGNIRTMINSIFNPNDEYDTIGFKEIRYGLDTENDVKYDPIVCSEYDKFSRQIEFFYDIYGEDAKILFLIRDIDSILRSVDWIGFKDPTARDELQKVTDMYIRYVGENKNTMLVEYDDLIDNDSALVSIKDFLGKKCDISLMKKEIQGKRTRG